MSLVKTYQKKFKCIDPENMKVSGDFNSDTAQLMNMRLIRCDPETSAVKCKSPEEITAFFRNKFLIFLFNEKYFDSNQYEENAIVEQGKILWLQVNTQVQQMLPYKISKTQIFLQDKDIDLDDLTEIYDSSIFQVEALPVRSYEKDYIVQMDISIEMNLD